MTLAPAAEVSLLAYLWPLFIVLMSSFLPGESLHKQHIMGAILVLVGCWLLIGSISGGFVMDNFEGYLPRSILTGPAPQSAFGPGLSSHTQIP
ncbi:MAG: DMT family transporter [Marinobacter sp.]|nr:DMT family transporter [Marinobacter sp.]